MKAGLVVFAIVLSCMGLIWLVDQRYNGVFREWFCSLFDVQPIFQNGGKIGIISRSWFQIKQFFVYAFLISVAILAAGMSCSSYFYSRYRRKKDIALMTEAINAFMQSNSDDLTFPEEYSHIAKQIIGINTASQKNQQLVQTEMQRKNDLITYLAHDLKTPLASVIGYLSLLDEAGDMPAEQKSKYVGIALTKAYRLEELINEFFDITRFNLQSIVLNTGKIKLAFMLQQLADEFYPMLAPQGKQADIHVPEELILTGDADKLARVFNNILKNAVAYSYDNSAIGISAVREGEAVVIIFTNQGDPIPAQKLDTIFEKFYRLDTARSTNTGGAGLGLAIAREIITAHGGTITVESNSEHTMFTVRLPS